MVKFRTAPKVKKVPTSSAPTHTWCGLRVSPRDYSAQHGLPEYEGLSGLSQNRTDERTEQTSDLAHSRGSIRPALTFQVSSAAWTDA